MFSYIFGYTEEVKEVFNENDVIEIKKLCGELQNDEDLELMYRSHTKNYELNKQIKRIATKIKLNKCTPNVYREDDSYLDQKEPIKKRIIKHHKRVNSLESVYEVMQRLSNHDKLIDETDNDMYGLSTPPTQPIPIPKRNRRR
jgi:hypothetical protein